MRGLQRAFAEPPTVSETNNTHPDLPSVLPEASGSYVFEAQTSRRSARLKPVSEASDTNAGAADAEAVSGPSADAA